MGTWGPPVWAERSVAEGMHLRQPALIALATAGFLAVAGPAAAAPNRTGELGGSVGEYKWDGGPVTGAPSAVGHISVVDDDTMLKVSSGGKLTVVLSDADDAAFDVDLYLYKADAAGERSGNAIISSEEGGSDEKISKEIVAGNYIVSVQGWAAVEGTYKGKATLAAAADEAPAAPTTPTPAAPAADATPLAKLAKLPKTSGKFTLKGTATDDVGVARVELAIVKTGKSCSQMTKKGTFTKLAKCAAPTSFLVAKGTKSWSFRLPKKLAKGSYVVFARAIDSKGQQQAGYGAANRKAFKVK